VASTLWMLPLREDESDRFFIHFTLRSCSASSRIALMANGETVAASQPTPLSIPIVALRARRPLLKRSTGHAHVVSTNATSINCGPSVGPVATQGGGGGGCGGGVWGGCAQSNSLLNRHFTRHRYWSWPARPMPAPKFLSHRAAPQAAVRSPRMKNLLRHAEGLDNIGRLLDALRMSGKRSHFRRNYCTRQEHRSQSSSSSLRATRCASTPCGSQIRRPTRCALHLAALKTPRPAQGRRGKQSYVGTWRPVITS